MHINIKMKNTYTLFPIIVAYKNNLYNKKIKNISFFDKIFMFFFCNLKIRYTFAYRKTINIYRRNEL